MYLCVCVYVYVVFFRVWKHVTDWVQVGERTMQQPLAYGVWTPGNVVVGSI